MPIQYGSAVTLRYTLSDETGYILYQGDEPLQFTVGAGDILPAFEAALIGGEAGEVKTFTLTPEQAFGPYQPEWVFRLSRHQLEGCSEEPIYPGQVLILSTPEGDSVQVHVLSVDEETIQVDANHPLAGKTLTYTVEILRVE
ncbi:MAG: peptidylprolyl isomerase [Bacteroidia bacterium]|nr:peptidylprolyl isomerase [Bacteroidia bacterium]MDW8014690.1 peptidylprolyl isomerase [Bacteroidia bacterium]